MKVFSATVTDVAAKIGNELLPVIDKYLGELDKWLSKSSNQEKITNAVAKAVTLFEEAVAAAGDVIKTMLGPTEAVVSALGGFKQVTRGSDRAQGRVHAVQLGRQFHEARVGCREGRR